MSNSPIELKDLLQRRQDLTEAIHNSPYFLWNYYLRSKTYAQLGYPDLAILDAYKTLLLADEALDDSGEYHEQVLKELEVVTLFSSAEKSEQPYSDELQEIVAEVTNASLHGLDAATFAEALGVNARVMLVHLLTTMGSLRSAYVFVQQVQKADDSLRQLGAVKIAAETDRFYAVVKKHFDDNGITFDRDSISIDDLPDRVLVRREMYPWNQHEQDRNTPEALQLLNTQMSNVSSKLEVKVVELPILSNENNDKSTSTIKQLGVFTKEDVAPGEEILREHSLLTANARFHEPLCDACSAELPSLGGQTNGSDNTNGNEALVPCENCDDVVFCSSTCHDLAQSLYHPAVCGTSTESIAKEVPPSEAADALYTLLLLRSLAMSQTQSIHPLDLNEVKYIWGDFTTPPPFATNTSLTPLENGDAYFSACPRTLPWSFSSNVLLPLHILEKMDLDIFAPDVPDLAEPWVWSTLLAKFRGTASGRVNPRDGRPEVAAVHPLWCLANHSCDPNVRWEWAGEIAFTCREKRVEWKRKNADSEVVVGREGTVGGIKKGEEVLNHYVDIDLPVKERREWGAGALGGNCMCERCIWEAGGLN